MCPSVCAEEEQEADELERSTEEFLAVIRRLDCAWGGGQICGSLWLQCAPWVASLARICFTGASGTWVPTKILLTQAQQHTLREDTHDYVWGKRQGVDSETPL